MGTKFEVPAILRLEAELVGTRVPLSSVLPYVPDWDPSYRGELTVWGERWTFSRPRFLDLWGDPHEDPEILEQTRMYARVLAAARAQELAGGWLPELNWHEAITKLWELWVAGSETPEAHLIRTVASRIFRLPPSRRQEYDADRAAECLCQRLDLPVDISTGYRLAEVVLQSCQEVSQHLLVVAGRSEVRLFRAMALSPEEAGPAVREGAWMRLPHYCHRRDVVASFAFGWEPGRKLVERWIAPCKDREERSIGTILRLVAQPDAVLMLPGMGFGYPFQWEVAVLSRGWTAWDAWAWKCPGWDEVDLPV